ncbi:D12 class N6 adenine-specific DNA methyltransferase family protein [Rickettsia hoogstraalii str. RCCE3]|nr:D12 class N6 adenine-specific DNA methyltransferase family protein [Rickettsia hoogstraalii str. RCCE3]
MRANNDSSDPIKITARFIYLNRYSFKGIYRVNINGEPSQSFSGRNYSKSDIASRLKQCSSLLTGTSICAIDFSFIEPPQNDFVYLILLIINQVRNSILDCLLIKMNKLDLEILF